MPQTYEFEAESLEDAIRQLIDEAAADAGESVDTHLRTRGYDPRRTGPVSVTVQVGDGAPRSDNDQESSRSEGRNDRRDDNANDSRGTSGSDDSGPTIDELDEDADVARLCEIAQISNKKHAQSNAQRKDEAKQLTGCIPQRLHKRQLVSIVAAINERQITLPDQAGQ